MIADVALWWRSRTPRERGLLGLMIFLLILVSSWFAVAQPLIHALDEARARHGAAVLAVAEARAEAELRRRATLRPAPAVAVPVERLLQETATAAGFAGARISAQSPTRATVAVDAARPQAFFAWIEDLQRRGLTVESLHAEINADRTVAAEATLHIGAR